MPEFRYTPTIALGADPTEYRLLTRDHVQLIEAAGRPILRIDPTGLRLLAREASRELAFFLRPSHLSQVAKILADPAASANDRYVASALLANAKVAAQGVLPSCQDTGTAIVVAKKGEQVWTDADDRAHLAHGIFDTYTQENLRYSQMAPLTMFEEVNTSTNLPAQIDIYAQPGQEYHFLFLAKGGGSANKTFLFQESKSLLNEASLLAFCQAKLPSLGTAACPPYHIALVIGGTSAEETLKIAKLASAHYLDELPIAGNPDGQAFRDPEWEKRLLTLAEETGLGAQFGGKYLAHDVRVIRLPRHAASCPVGLAVSCSADRNLKGKITQEGIFIEQMAHELGPDLAAPQHSGNHPVEIDLNRPLPEILAQLKRYPVGTLLHLQGDLLVARDLAHARVAERLAQGQPLPEYFKNHPIYYAGPAKTPAGLPSGSFGPTTAGRMDSYVDSFQAHGGSLIMVAKGNRTPEVTAACRRHGGFYLGSIGGAAAILAQESIRQVEVVDFAELGMEAIRRITVSNFPAFIICDDKGNDLYQQIAADRGQGAKNDRDHGRH